MFGKGWLYCFQKLQKFNSRRVHRESGSTKVDAIETGRETLRRAVTDYADGEIYNMDETACYYCVTSQVCVSSEHA